MRQGPYFRGRGRGFTLVELMAVIVIMALAAGFILPGVAAADDASQCRLMAAKLRDLDRKARLLARSEGMVVCIVDEEARSFALSVRSTDERVTVLDLPPGTTAVLRTDGDSHSIMFDRNGRSSDYEIEVTCGAHSIAYRVAGTTGHINEVER